MSILNAAHKKGMQVMSPHCLVAPGYVAPTEVTSPQRSYVAPTSELCRPNILIVSPQHINCVAPSSKLCRPIEVKH